MEKSNRQERTNLFELLLRAQLVRVTALLLAAVLGTRVEASIASNGKKKMI